MATFSFSTKRPAIIYGSSSSRNLDQDRLPFGQIISGLTPSLFWDRGRLLLTPEDEGLAEMEGDRPADMGIATSVTTLARGAQIYDDFDESDDPSDTDGIQDAQRASVTCLSSIDIVSWRGEVVESGAELLSLTPSPFERGVIGSQIVNDILMIKGLMHSPVYIQFLDLSSFSCS